MENGGPTHVDETQVLQRIQDMEKQGLVDSMFRHIYALKEYNGPLFFANLFPTFNNDVSATLEKMTELLKANALDYQALSKYIIKLEGSAGFMGATRMRKACSGLRQACENKSFEGCRQAFNEIKCEYGALRNHFDIILKLEKALLASQAENRGKSSPASTCSSSSTS